MRAFFSLIGAASVLAVVGAGSPVLQEPEYVGAQACADCHAALAEGYQRVGMARTLEPIASAPAIEDWNSAPFYHEASDQYFEMSRRDGRSYQRRFLLDESGAEVHSLEMEIGFAIGSGHKERDYLARLPGGELVQMPVVWYTEEAAWGIAPGFDTPNHDGFTRRINYRCIFCHAAYPDLDPGQDRYEAQIALYPADVGESIDCERCHGPGSLHVSAALADAPSVRIRETIVNPSSLDRDRQMDVCLQCHLETTSAPLPSSLVKLGRGVFSFRPGEALTSYAAYFDFPPGSEHDDDFNIVHQGYQLVRSACYLGSDMTCTSCHDPHSKPDSPTDYFRQRCLDCHRPEGCSAAPDRRAASDDDCASCHMPQRRTDDIVHVTMTDHYIRKDVDPGLLEPIVEKDNTGYRGALAFYLPEPRANLYLGLGLVRGANVEDGVRRLEESIEADPSGIPEPYFDLAAGYARLGRTAAAIGVYRLVIATDPDYAEAHYNLGLLYLETDRVEEALERFLEAIRLQPGRADNHLVAGVARAAMGSEDLAVESYRRALELDPLSALALNNLGMLAAADGRSSEAIALFDRVLAIDPNDSTALSMLDRLQR